MKSAAFSPEWLESRLAALLPGYPEVPVCVALSGGVDSVALLAALAQQSAGHGRAPSKHRRLRAVHIHHGLHPNAGKWSDHCRELAARLQVPLTVIRVKVAAERGDSIEAAAREARYAAFSQALEPGEALLTAHHQDDQLETVILQLLRGAGIPGLAAMPEIASFERGWLVRPLLVRTRAELEGWAQAQGLAWVDDDTNANEQFDRNYLRRNVLPLVRARWPSAGSAVARSARHAAEARRLLDSVARADVERASNGAGLAVHSLRALDPDRRRNAVRFWIARAGHSAPDTRRLEEIVGPLLDARADANPSVSWNGVTVRRDPGVLSIDTSPGRGELPAVARDVVWNWLDAPLVELYFSGGTLEIERDRHGPLDLDALPATLVVRTRHGGESLRPGPGARNRRLKALLQEARVPVSERDSLPLIFAGEKLLAVSDRWLDASVQATRASANRGRFRFSGGTRA
jgi:tRNA(Ile)-lysidine synthase